MFRGGDYIDDPSFNDLRGRPGYNYMDVSDITGMDRYGNGGTSPTHQKYKLKRDQEKIRSGQLSPERSMNQSRNLGFAGNQIVMSSPQKSLLPPAGQRKRPPTGEMNFNEVVKQSPEYLQVTDADQRSQLLVQDINGADRRNQWGQKTKDVLDQHQMQVIMQKHEENGNKYISDSHRYYSPWKNGKHKNPTGETFNGEQMLNVTTAVAGSPKIRDILEKKKQLPPNADLGGNLMDQFESHKIAEKRHFDQSGNSIVNYGSLGYKSAFPPYEPPQEPQEKTLLRRRESPDFERNDALSKELQNLEATISNIHPVPNYHLHNKSAVHQAKLTEYQLNIVQNRIQTLAPNTAYMGTLSNNINQLHSKMNNYRQPDHFQTIDPVVLEQIKRKQEQQFAVQKIGY